jgi:hypothetical protein
VDSTIIDIIPSIVARLEETKNRGKTAFLGFDACIDNIAHIVRSKDEENVVSFFSDSDQFGKFLLGLENKSCGIELHTRLSKIGGNMVIMSNALGNLDVVTECIGTFGYPSILPVFMAMSPNCSLHTISDTITATALEFNNSKIIMFDPGPYDCLHWEGIKDTLGLETIKKMISGKELIAFVNWSEIENSSLIWKGFLDDVFPGTINTAYKPFFFTDFSDCSRRSKQEIRIAIDLLGKFRNYFKVHISLNQNEADLIAEALDLPENESDEYFIREIYRVCNSDILVIHRVNDALAFDGLTFVGCETFLCKDPVILTGGGDNFNAGFCYSMLNDFDLFQSLVVANAVSGSYVRNGISPDVDNLIKFLKKFPADSAD